MYIEGTNRYDYPKAYNGNDTYYLKKGNDRVMDYYGNDTYLFNLGDGQDNYTDQNGYDVIRFGPGITKDKVTFIRSGNNVIVKILGTTDQITVVNWYRSSKYEIEKIEFTDGSFYTNTDVKNIIAGIISPINGTGNSDTLIGTSGNDTMNGMGGNDSLAGLSGNDTYIFNSGFGQDIIRDISGNDSIRMNTPVENLEFARDNSNLIIKLKDSTDMITVQDWFNGQKIEKLELLSGVALSSQDIESKIPVNGEGTVGTAGNDSLIGSSGNDDMYGLAGNDSIRGLNGNDTITGGTGADTMEGGSGNDIYYVDDPGDTVIEVANAIAPAQVAPPDTSWIRSDYLKDIYARTFPRVMGNQWHVAPDGLFNAATRYKTVNGATQVDWDATIKANNGLVDIVSSYFDYLNLNRASARIGTNDKSDLFLDNYDSIFNPGAGLLKNRNDIYNAAAELARKVYVLAYLNISDVWTYQSTNVHSGWDFWHSQKYFNDQNFGTWDYCNANNLFVVKNGETLHYGTDSSRPLFDSSNPLWQQYYADHVRGILEAGFDGIMSDNWMRSRWTGDTSKLTATEFTKLQQGWNQAGLLIREFIGDKFLIGNSPPDSTYTGRDVCFLEDRIDDLTGTNDKSIASYFRYTDLARNLNQVCQDTYWNESQGPFETFRLPMNLLTDNILGVGSYTNNSTSIESYFKPVMLLGDIGHPTGDRQIVSGTGTGIRDTIQNFSMERGVYARYYSDGVSFVNCSDIKQSVTLSSGQWLRSDGAIFNGGSSIALDPYRGWVLKKIGDEIVDRDKIFSSVTYTTGENVEDLELTGTGSINATGNDLGNILTGNSGNNVISGMKGNDSLLGGSGNDTYLFSRGDGIDQITDASGLDTIKLGAGITQEDLVFFRIDVDSLLINLKSSQDQIIVNDSFQEGFNVERIEFDDGSYLTSSQVTQIIQEMSVQSGTASIQTAHIENALKSQSTDNLLVHYSNS